MVGLLISVRLVQAIHSRAEDSGAGMVWSYLGVAMITPSTLAIFEQRQQQQQEQSYPQVH